MSSDNLVKESHQCNECGGEIEPPDRRDWEPEDLAVCTDCWFDELSGEERKEHAERAHERREERRAG